MSCNVSFFAQPTLVSLSCSLLHLLHKHRFGAPDPLYRFDNCGRDRFFDTVPANPEHAVAEFGYRILPSTRQGNVRIDLNDFSPELWDPEAPETKQRVER